MGPSSIGCPRHQSCSPIVRAGSGWNLSETPLSATSSLPPRRAKADRQYASVYVAECARESWECGFSWGRLTDMPERHGACWVRSWSMPQRLGSEASCFCRRRPRLSTNGGFRRIHKIPRVLLRDHTLCYRLFAPLEDEQAFESTISGLHGLLGLLLQGELGFEVRRGGNPSILVNRDSIIRFLVDPTSNSSYTDIFSKGIKNVVVIALARVALISLILREAIFGIKSK